LLASSRMPFIVSTKSFGIVPRTKISQIYCRGFIF